MLTPDNTFDNKIRTFENLFILLFPLQNKLRKPLFSLKSDYFVQIISVSRLSSPSSSGPSASWSSMGSSGSSSTSDTDDLLLNETTIQVSMRHTSFM